MEKVNLVCGDFSFLLLFFFFFQLTNLKLTVKLSLLLNHNQGSEVEVGAAEEEVVASEKDHY